MSRCKIMDTGNTSVKVYAEVADIVEVTTTETVDLSRLTAITRNRVVKALNEGFPEHWGGKAKTIYTYLCKHFHIPQGSVNVRHYEHKLHYHVHVVTPRTEERDNLCAFLSVALPDSAKSYYENHNGPQEHYFTLTGSCPTVTGDMHPKQIFRTAFDACYGEKITTSRALALEALTTGAKLIKTFEV